MLFSGMISQSTTQGMQGRLCGCKRVKNKNPSVSDKSGTEGFMMMTSVPVSFTLAVSQGRNQDKWSKVQPYDKSKFRGFTRIKKELCGSPLLPPRKVYTTMPNFMHRKP